MAASETAIANMALSHLAIDKEIQSLVESSANARACNRFYEQVRDEVLRDFPWPFARRTATLVVVSGTPNEWVYQYRVPSDAIAIVRLLPYGTTTGVTGARMETAASRVPFVMGSDATGGLIWTDFYTAAVEYTAKITDVTQFPPDFTQAVSLLLAGYIAPRLTDGDEHKLGARALQLYDWRIQKARANAANEMHDDTSVDSEFITERG